MKYIIWISFVFGFGLMNAEVVRVRVTDDNAQPIAGTEVRVIFAATLADGTRDVIMPFVTDQRGTGAARGRAEFRITILATKPGFYDVRVDGLRAGQDHDVALVLRERIKPIPLYVAQVGLDRIERFPKHDVWLGFDFSKADWVSPYGQGEVEDIRVKFSNKFSGWGPTEDRMAEIRRINFDISESDLKQTYGKWHAAFEVSFPGSKDGLIEETLRYLPYNTMRLPHEAPTDGYRPNWRVEAETYIPRQRRENVGFFLRTRTKLDSQGNIISAHYAKITGDIEVDARGSIKFHYYFNPTANDRNLEFAYERNLFPKELIGARYVPHRP